MSTPHADEPGDLIPRPATTFPALRTALARLDPARLPEYQADRDQAFTLATRHASFHPIRVFLTKWATEIEIERRPAVAARYHAALNAANTLDGGDPAWRAAMDECLAIHNEARAAQVPPLTP